MRSVPQLKSFYASRTGRLVRRIICRNVEDLWESHTNLRVMVYGFGQPYLGMFQAEAERCFGLCPAAHKSAGWPKDSKRGNLIGIAADHDLPLETASVDRVFIIHHFEYADKIPEALSEIWRVLKGQGSVVLVVPSRRGLWARADCSPFGQGAPFSREQICRYVQEADFLVEAVKGALHFPPRLPARFLKTADFIEGLGQAGFPLVPGVHILTLKKQLFSPVSPSSGSKVAAGLRGLIRPPAVEPSGS